MACCPCWLPPRERVFLFLFLLSGEYFDTLAGGAFEAQAAGGAEGQEPVEEKRGRGGSSTSGVERPAVCAT